MHNRWREERARSANIPRNWLADNDTLLSLARSRPKTIDDLRAFRGLKGGEINKSGPRILEAIEKSKEFPKEKLPKITASNLKRPSDDTVLDLIRSFVIFLSEKHEVASRFLLNTQRIPLLYSERNEGRKKWIESEILSASSDGLIGADLEAFLQGKMAMRIVNDKVDLLQV
jgi:ribonuclease D